MVLSPAIFERFGWRGVASITPQVLLGCGSSFLATCAVYQLAFANSAAAAAAGTTHGEGTRLKLTVEQAEVLWY